MCLWGFENGLDNGMQFDRIVAKSEENTMKEKTEKMFRLIVGDDETITAGQAEEALSILRGEMPGGGDDDEILTRREAAEILNVTKTTITNLANENLIKRIRIPGRRKSLGFSKKSVIELKKSA